MSDTIYWAAAVAGAVLYSATCGSTAAGVVVFVIWAGLIITGKKERTT